MIDPSFREPERAACFEAAMRGARSSATASRERGEPSFFLRGASGSSSEPSRTSPTSIIVAVSSPTLLYGLGGLVTGTMGMRLTGATQSIDGLRAYLEWRGDAVALIDPFLAGHDGTRAVIEAARGAAPWIRFVLISDEHQPHLIKEAVKAGASGFVGASSDTGEIQTALLEAAHGRRFFSPAVAARLAESLALEDLTPREMDVLTLLARGNCNKTIARVLGVTVGTVKTHIRAIMGKLDSGSRTEAVLKACRFGLVGLYC